MNRLPRWLLISLFAVNSMVAAFLIGGASSSPVQAQDGDQVQGSTGETEPSREALRVLGDALVKRAEALTLREADYEELKRDEELRLRRALTESPAAVPGESTETGAATALESEAAEPDAADQAFARLSKAYENMEPDSAAKAMKELAALDRNAVVQLLAGWPPRTSGAILDSLTQIEPALAARLSYEIWKRAGNDESSAASSGR